PTTSTFTVAACGTYTWAAKGNKQYTASNTTDTIMLKNAAGCDSIVTLNLTITNCPLTTLNITNNSATNAYSVRKLTAAYTGFALRVRRSSDNNTQDIGFTTAGDLDTASLKTFIGSNSGFVTIWYDQSGNGNNATNTNNATQPSIVVNGVVNRLAANGNKPTITAATATNALSFAVSPNISGNGLTANAVATMQAATPAFGRLVSLSNGNTTNDFDNNLYTSAIIRNNTNNQVMLYRNFTDLSRAAITLNAATVITSTINGADYSIYANNTFLNGSLTPALNTNLGISFGRIFNHTNNGDATTGWVGSASEVLLFATPLNTTDRQSMEATQTNYYLMIYTTWNGTTWSNGAPSSTVDAIIASNTAPASFTCKALTINSTFALNTTGITATVNGNIVNNGNGIAGTGGLIVNANSTISGTAISFNGALTVNTGATLTTGGLLTLASNATNTARVANSAGNISGTVAVQRYLPGKRAYRFVTAPLSSNGLTDVFINNSWQTQTHIVGPS
ncbi:MAG: arabinofuranosidase catalytic domain-containing protein, partial [Dolichospermum sp.]